MKNWIQRCAVYFFMMQFSDSAYPAELQTLKLSGRSILDSSEFNFSPHEKQFLVVVFLSSRCPCSNSHLEKLRSLKADFPTISFVGVHSNSDEPPAEAKAYFLKAHLPFPIVEDPHSHFANAFGASKTPHAFVVNSQREVLYKGGVTDSAVAESSSRFYLKEALLDLSQGSKVKTSESRTLGCIISREEK